MDICRIKGYGFMFFCFCKSPPKAKIESVVANSEAIGTEGL